MLTSTPACAKLTPVHLLSPPHGNPHWPLALHGQLLLTLRSWLECHFLCMTLPELYLETLILCSSYLQLSCSFA